MPNVSSKTVEKLCQTWPSCCCAVLMLHGVLVLGCCWCCCLVLLMLQRQPNVLFPGALPLASAGVGGYDYQPLQNLITNMLLWYTIYYQHIPLLYDLYHLYTIYIPFIYHLYTIYIPFIYHLYTIYIPFIYHLYSIYIPFIRYYTYYDYQHIYHALYHFAVKTLRHPCGWWRSSAI